MVGGRDLAGAVSLAEVLAPLVVHHSLVGEAVDSVAVLIALLSLANLRMSKEATV